MTTFLQAAASYYGLGETNTRKSEVFTENGEMIFIVELKVSPEDMIAIAGRMEAMQEAEQSITPSSDYDAGKDRLFEQMGRNDYNALDPVTKGKFGSFARFMAWDGVLPSVDGKDLSELAGALEDANDVIADPKFMGADGRKVEHLDAPEEESTGLPEAVWIDDEDCSPEQRMVASDTDFILRRQLIQVSMLTEEQKTVYREVIAKQRARYVQQGEQHG